MLAGGVAVGGTAREDVLAANGHVARAVDVFTVTEVFDELMAHGFDLPEGPVRGRISSPVSGGSPDHHGTTSEGLEAGERGLSPPASGLVARW